MKKKYRIMKEEWKDINGYDGDYQISNFGNVISYKKCRGSNSRILKPYGNGKGYFVVSLSKNNKKQSHRIHLLVWEYFGDGKRNGYILCVDHRDNCKDNNRIDNLQLISQRENTSKDKNKSKTSSKYTGVSWEKYKKKWKSQIRINGKSKHLGYFDNELEASKTYQKKINEI